MKGGDNWRGGKMDGYDIWRWEFVRREKHYKAQRAARPREWFCVAIPIQIVSSQSCKLRPSSASVCVRNVSFSSRVVSTYT